LVALIAEKVGGDGGFSGASSSAYHRLMEHLVLLQEVFIRVSTRALLFSEIDRFNADRFAILRTAMAQLGACSVQYNKKVNALWCDSVDRMDLDMEKGAESAKSIMAATMAIAREEKSC